MPDRGSDQGMHARDDVAPHLEHKHRQCDDGGEAEITLQERLLGILAGGFDLFFAGILHDFSRGVAGFGHCGDQGGWPRRSYHDRPLCREVDAGGGDTSYGLKRALHPTDARRAAHAVDGKCGGLTGK